MIDQKVLNRVIDTLTSAPLMPDCPYIVFVESISISGFFNLEQAMEYFEELIGMVGTANVLLLWNSRYGDNKETSNV